MIRKNISRRCHVLVTALVLAALVLAMLPMSAFAAGGLTMSTVYTGMTVKAGAAVSYPLTFTNTAAGESVDLSVYGKPSDSWTTYFYGNNTYVDSIFVENGTLSGAVTFNVVVPSDTPDGTYEIVIRAKGATKSSDLKLKLKVEAVELGESVLDVVNTKQDGTASDTFSFTAEIRNNTGKEVTYNMRSWDVPSNWSVYFKENGVVTSTVTVPAGSSSTVTIEVYPAAAAAADTYTFKVAAGELEPQQLSVAITGSYSLEITTPDGLLSFDAYANKETEFSLVVKNTGNAPLNNITLNTTGPSGWVISYSQSTIATLAAGESVEITAKLLPSENALAGDYAISIDARAGADAKATVALRTTVKTETVWGIAGVLLIVAALVGLWFVFRKFGRR